MTGRYGGDQLSIVLLITSVLFTLISSLTKLPLLALVGYIPLGLCIFRMLSKNVTKRSMENYKFSILVSPVYSWFKKMQQRVLGAKTHKYFKCPNCKAQLRIPKGKGKIVITCPKCKTEFEAKS
jgi:uncharacterized protein YbaR (Trm112 family)